MKANPENPSIEDLETTVKVLEVIAGNKETWPYIPIVKEPAEEVLKELNKTLIYRKGIK